ncbi:retrotransposon protein, putative, Ty1-copia sub-class [Cucumis melo var. makuwa]|uniref:Retrotransposon protein, putative, Ty1-copia sub-class n=1 Tax=Cucumis melo var. makuwa TaxID=1194695 RepID=A0A5A7U6A4_CUCMM|nr:retrotransposon protein, putative, Ty1-copia sub-class [Cucumis melo var. makuwa]TYK07615.1 retrotransposon protein, putative, Ty1-copia sub-class [Cucumis melo var. makuwa]
MSSPKAPYWKEAVNSEIESIMHNHTWKPVDLPLGSKSLGCKWTFKRKMKTDGSVDKYKARLVAKGYKQQEGLDYFDTYSPVTRITSIHMLIAISALHGFEIHQMEVKTTFLNGSNISIIKTTKQILLQLEYSCIIGSLMYIMSCTRPDIAYAISKLSRYISNPGQDHWKAILRILGYLKHTKNYGLHYTRYPVVLEGYNDANWISSTKDSKSTSSYIFTFGGGVVSWKSSKQTCVARSTMESEFIALNKAGEEVE